jgi:hypothetical protein
VKEAETIWLGRKTDGSSVGTSQALDLMSKDSRECFAGIVISKITVSSDLESGPLSARRESFASRWFALTSVKPVPKPFRYFLPGRQIKVSKIETYAE